MRAKLPLLLILLIGIATPVLSTLFFFLAPPSTQTNAGELLTPNPIPTNWKTQYGTTLNPDDWRGKWVLVNISDEECGRACQQRLCQMRQLRLMLHGSYFRLQRFWLIAGERVPISELPLPIHCGETNISDAVIANAQVEDVLEGVEYGFGKRSDFPNGGEDALYLIDPMGLWVMRFPSTLSIYQIRTDIARLLKISKGQKTIAR